MCSQRPAGLHAWQMPSHAASQQTRAPSAPAATQCPSAQSSSSSQGSPRRVLLGTRQAPSPSHVPVPCWQGVPAGSGKAAQSALVRHTPNAAQLRAPSPPPNGRHSLLWPLHVACGHRRSFGAAEHTPMLPARLHAAHSSVHGESQQTPSTQLPALQSVSSSQLAPRAPTAPRGLPLVPVGSRLSTVLLGPLSGLAAGAPASKFSLVPSHAGNS